LYNQPTARKHKGTKICKEDEKKLPRKYPGQSRPQESQTTKQTPRKKKKKLNTQEGEKDQVPVIKGDKKNKHNPPGPGGLSKGGFKKGATVPSLHGKKTGSKKNGHKGHRVNRHTKKQAQVAEGN